MAEGTQPDEVRVGGRYVLGDMLGRGGMAEVRKGTDVRLGRTVAVKRLRTDLATDPTFQARFRREAQAAAGLNHPNIVSVYDTGEEMAPDGSHVQPYIVMEYVQGRTLREVLNDGRKLLPERALEITSGVLAALDYSHRAGIIHRDIKPANVMLTPSGDVKVMDFGIARAIADGTSTMTQTSAVVGTAQYLSPEQARGETVDSRSDVYSTGCLLYELLTGRPPFVGDSPFSVAYQHVREAAQPPRVHNSELPEEVDAITMKALAKKLDDRYQSAAEMRADIQRYLDGQPVDAPTAVVAAPVAAPVGEETSIFRPAEDEAYDEEPRKRRRWPLVLGLLIVLGLLVGGIALAVALMNSAEEVSVPDLSDQGLGQARRSLEDAGLSLGSVDRQASEVQEGLVIDQDPEPDSLVEEDTSVDVVLSSGPDTTTVPSLIGDTRATAEAELEERDLVGEFREEDSTEPAGTVIRTDPEAGDEIEVGGTVVVVLSLGPVEVPNVVGRPEGRATDILENAGFDVAVEEDAETPSEPGQVLEQDPSAGAEVARGSTVTITVSRYEEPEPTPTETPTETPSETPTETPSETPTETPSETPTDEQSPGAGAPAAPGTEPSPVDGDPGSEPADGTGTEPVAAAQQGPTVRKQSGRRPARRRSSP